MEKSSTPRDVSLINGYCVEGYGVPGATIIVTFSTYNDDPEFNEIVTDTVVADGKFEI